MMRFLFPTLFFVWAALALLVLALYLFRPKPRTVKTSTLPFFKWLAREHQDSTWLKRLKHLASLLLSLAVVLAAAAALGRLVISPNADDVNTVVVLVDRSASMAAVNEHRQSRLQDAISKAKNRLAGLPVGVGVIIVAYDQRPEVLLSRRTDRREIDRCLDEIRSRPIAGKFDVALHLANKLAIIEPPGVVWHVTDGEPLKSRTPTNPESMEESPIKSVSTSPTSPINDAPSHIESTAPVQSILASNSRLTNVGITAFQLRRLPLQKARFEAFIQIAAQASESLPAELEIQLDGKLVGLRKLTLKPGGQETLLVPVEASHSVDRVLSLKMAAAHDALEFDNLVEARVPRLRPVKVLWIAETPDPFTELALASLGTGDVQVMHGGPKTWPPSSDDMPDVVLFDGWIPQAWPTRLPAIVLNPPQSVGPVKAVRIAAGLPVDTVRAPLDTHPVLYGVANQRVALMQTAALSASGTLTPLWIGPQGPLLLAGESAGQRVVVMAFSPQQSEQLPLLASYPLLIGNAIYWSANEAFAAATGHNHRTGDLLPLNGKHLKWLVASKENDQPQTAGRHVELDRIGLWEIDGGPQGSAALLSHDETLLPDQSDARVDEKVAPSRAWASGDMLPLLLWTMLTILVAESWLYHRYLVY